MSVTSAASEAKEKRQALQERERKRSEKLALTDERLRLIRDKSADAAAVEFNDRQGKRSSKARLEEWSAFYAILSADQVHEMAREILLLRDAIRRISLDGSGGIFVVEEDYEEPRNIPCPTCVERSRYTRDLCQRIPTKPIEESE